MNFDATYELEEMLLEDNPLKASPRRRASNRAPRENESKYQEIEEKFEPYSIRLPKRTSFGCMFESDWLTAVACRCPEQSFDRDRVDDDRRVTGPYSRG